METTLVVNSSAMQMHVDIILEGGIKDSVNIMPKSRAYLPPGASVCPNFAYLNPKLKIQLPIESISKSITKEV